MIDNVLSKTYSEASKGRSMLVYTIENKVNGKIYVGATTRSLTKRYTLNWDLRLLSNNEIRDDYKKYGQSSFKLKILKRPKTKEKLSYWEAFYIKKLKSLYPNGYNFQSGGFNGIVIHDETKKRISETMKKSFLPHRGVFNKKLKSQCLICEKDIFSYRIRGKLKATCSDICFRKLASINMTKNQRIKYGR